MARLIGVLVIGGLIMLLASTNAHIVQTNLGPLVIAAPHFVVLGASFFFGFATAVFLVLGNLLKRRNQKSPGKSIVIRR